MANVFQALQNAGAKVYERSPLWERGRLVAKLPAGSFTVTKNQNYDAHSVCVSAPEGTVYVQIKQGTPIDKAAYEVYEFSAVRDWAEYNISAGETKLMAV